MNGNPESRQLFISRLLRRDLRRARREVALSHFPSEVFGTEGSGAGMRGGLVGRPARVWNRGVVRRYRREIDTDINSA